MRKQARRQRKMKMTMRMIPVVPGGKREQLLRKAVLSQCARAGSDRRGSRTGTTTPRVLRALPAAAAAETKMAARIAAFLKSTWAKEPVLVASFTIGALAIIVPTLSPSTRYAVMINRSTPYNYPVPVRDDGNMPDVPSHPQDPQGPSLDWLKKL
nr:PREDICTED: NADH dehydrogenase [ubiquinone] 1 alpha subcomplex subunit 3 isoform X4 [Camelus bactrianus]